MKGELGFLVLILALILVRRIIPPVQSVAGGFKRDICRDAISGPKRRESRMWLPGVIPLRRFQVNIDGNGRHRLKRDHQSAAIGADGDGNVRAQLSPALVLRLRMEDIRAARYPHFELLRARIEAHRYPKRPARTIVERERDPKSRRAPHDCSGEFEGRRSEEHTSELQSR